MRGSHGPLLVDERGAATISPATHHPFPLQDPVVFERRDRSACRAAGALSNVPALEWVGYGERHRCHSYTQYGHANGHGGAPPTMRAVGPLAEGLPANLGIATLVLLR